MADVTLNDLAKIVPCDRKKDAAHVFGCPSGYHSVPVSRSDIIVVIKQMGGMEAHAVPVLPGGPPLWVNAGGPGRYLIILSRRI
jgi:hypothetical protein